jgi:methionine-gamma-lyase
MMSHGYRPEGCHGALKPPVFETSTFVFRTAEEGKRFFELATGQRTPEPGEHLGMIYSRLDNPNLAIVEARLTVWDGGDAALVFPSGMAAIATTMLTWLRPGQVLLHSGPLYGGTDHLVKHVVRRFGIIPVEFMAVGDPGLIEAELERCAPGADVGMIFVETPANPTNDLFDIAGLADLAASRSRAEDRCILAVDNTFLGPRWQRPLEHGADLVVYSATKYLGGHSDLVAGAVVGHRALVEPIAATRTYLGTVPSPMTAWLLTRSLETLGLRMERQASNAGTVARFLADHPKVRGVRYLGLLDADDADHDLFKRQCVGAGAMIAFEVGTTEAEAFRFLDHLELIRLAVSLGGTESLAEHPATMTHAGVDPADKTRFGITPTLVRLSIGIESAADLVGDVAQALEAV